MKFSLKTLLLALPVFTSMASAQSISIDLLSATVKGQKIDNAAITLQKNDTRSVTARSDAAGKVRFDVPFSVDRNSLLTVAGGNRTEQPWPCVSKTG